MTEASFRELPPMMQGIIRRRCLQKGVGIAGFPESEAERLRLQMSRASAVVGRDLSKDTPRKSDEDIRLENEAAKLSAFIRTVPDRYKDADLSKDFKAPFVQSLHSGQSGIVVGMNGLGKTRLAWALSLSWKRENPSCSVIITKGARMLSDIKSVEGDWYRYIEDEYGRADHLFIDEIDKIKGSEADWMLLTYLIDYRYEWCRQTVVMGNCSKDEILDLIGQSSYSRLSGDGARAYSLTGIDRRKEG